MKKEASLKKSSPVIRLLLLMKPYRFKLVLAALLIILANMADLVKPRIYQIIIDDFLPGGGMQSGSFFTGTLMGLGISYFLVIFISAASSLLQSRMITHMCQQILHETRMKVFGHIHRMKLHDLDEMGSGRLLTRVTNDVEALDEFYGDVLSGLFRDVLLLAGIVIMMLTMDWRLALVGEQDFGIPEQSRCER